MRIYGGGLGFGEGQRASGERIGMLEIGIGIGIAIAIAFPIQYNKGVVRLSGGKGLMVAYRGNALHMIISLISSPLAIYNLNAKFVSNQIKSIIIKLENNIYIYIFKFDVECQPNRITICWGGKSNS